MIELKINVTVGVTPVLERVLTGLMEDHSGCTAKERENDRVINKVIDRPEETAEPEPAPDVAAMADAPEAGATEEPAATVEPETPAETATEGEDAPATVAPPTKEEMKTLMDITISKFAGNGWQETKESKTMAVIKSCTKAFKQIARHLGADKPTALEGDQRTAFINELDNLYLNGEGVVEWKAF